MLHLNLGERGKRGRGDANKPALALCLFVLSLAHEIKYNLLGQEVSNEMTRKILLSLKISSDLKNIFSKSNEKALFPISMCPTILPHYSALPVKGGKSYLFSLTPES